MQIGGGVNECAQLKSKRPPIFGPRPQGVTEGSGHAKTCAKAAGHALKNVPLLLSAHQGKGLWRQGEIRSKRALGNC